VAFCEGVYALFVIVNRSKPQKQLAESMTRRLQKEIGRCDYPLLDILLANVPVLFKEVQKI
jgi:hypothetical protein